MGLGTLLVTILASIKPKFIEDKIWRYYLWLSASLVIGYILFEGIILLTATLMVGDIHGLTVAILERIFVKNIVWAIALELIKSHGFPAHKTLGAGVVDGRNIGRIRIQ